jgi:hypothetical protein
MIRVFQIAVLSCSVLVLIGCSSPEKDRPIWEDTKIFDLVPSRREDYPAGGLLKTMNFDVYTFEIPAENIGLLGDVWEMLYTRHLRFNDYGAFVANFFLAGFGQVQMWDRVGDLLRSAGGKKVETVSFLIHDGQSSDLGVAGLDKEQTIWYFPAAASMEGVTIGPGRLGLRIKAEKIPGSRGVCSVNIHPVSLSQVRGSILQLKGREKSNEFSFTSVGFGLKMVPGDFVFLGPKEYISHRVTLGSLFFSIPGRRPVVRTYLIFCTAIVY